MLLLTLRCDCAETVPTGSPPAISSVSATLLGALELEITMAMETPDDAIIKDILALASTQGIYDLDALVTACPEVNDTLMGVDAGETSPHI